MSKSRKAIDPPLVSNRGLGRGGSMAFICPDNIVIEKPERDHFQRYIETIPPRHRRRFCVNSLLKWNSISPYFYRWFRLDVMGILFPLTLRGFLSDFPLTLWGISVSRFSPYGDFFRQPPPTTPTTSQKSPTTIT